MRKTAQNTQKTEPLNDYKGPENLIGLTYLDSQYDNDNFRYKLYIDMKTNKFQTFTISMRKFIEMKQNPKIVIVLSKSFNPDESDNKNQKSKRALLGSYDNEKCVYTFGYGEPGVEITQQSDFKRIINIPDFSHEELMENTLFLKTIIQQNDKNISHKIEAIAFPT